MTDEKVLQAYRAGHRDFKGKNLKGKSFEEEKLSGADFSCADIRGANFSRATLIGTNFTGVRAGLSERWLSVFLSLSIILMLLTGMGAVLVGVITISTFSPTFTKEFGYVPAIIVSLISIVFLVTSLRMGILPSIGALAATIAITVPIGALTGPILAGTGPIAFVGALIPVSTLCAAFATTMLFTLAGIENQFLVKNVAGIGLLGCFGSGYLAWLIARAITDGNNGAFENSLNVAGVGELTVEKMGLVFSAIAMFLVIVSLGIYVGWQATKEDDRFTFVLRSVIRLNAAFGTSFQGANLTDATFVGAILKNTDLRAVNLTHTCWLGVRGLEFARLPSGYLEDRKIFKLVITGDGQSQNFDRCDLQGLCLRNAKLSKASFIGTNLNQAILQDAILQDTSLVQTLLDGTDLSGADLTGACIQDWAITESTKIQDIKCRWVFMQLKQRRETGNIFDYRKPDDVTKEFKEGEFAEFFTILIKTLDLYHEQGINPRAVAVALKRLMSQNLKANLELMAVEKPGRNNEKLLLRVKAKEKTDLSKLSQEYFTLYNSLRELPSNSPQLTIAASDAKVRGLLVMIAGFASNPRNKIRDSVQYLGDSKVKDILIKILEALENSSGLPSGDEAILIDQVKLLAAVAISPDAYNKNDVRSTLRLLNGLISNLLPTNPLLSQINTLCQEIAHLCDL